MKYGNSKNWKLERTPEDEPYPYGLYELDENQAPIRHSGRRYQTEKLAMADAKFLNDNGANVFVFKEIAACWNRPEG